MTTPLGPILDVDGRFIGRSYRCDCGNTIETYGGHDTYCDRCQRDYNAFGQQLAPRSQWEG